LIWDKVLINNKFLVGGFIMLRRIFLFFFIFMFFSIILAENKFEAPAEFQKVAKKWADSNFPGKINKGTPYNTLDGTQNSWVFIINKKYKDIADKEQLRNSIKTFHDLKKEAEIELDNAKSCNDSKNIQKWSSQITENMKKMRNAEEYATVFVFQGKDKPYVGMAYNGLPPHIVTFYDVETQAKIKLNTDDPVEGDYYFLGFTDMFMGFKNNEKGFYVNMMQEDIIIPDTLFQKIKTSKRLETIESHSPENKKQKIMTNESGEVIINGVPSYFSANGECQEPDFKNYDKGCVPISVAMVLGYWNDHGYDRLIDGDENQEEFQPGSTYPGTYNSVLKKYVDGYYHLIDSEIYPAGPFTLGQTAGIEDGEDAILGVCTYSKYHNYYEFNTTIYDDFGDYDVDGSWDLYCSEINHNPPRPFVMSYSKYLLTLDPVLVAEILFHYPDWEYADQGGHAVCAVGYKYVNYAAERTDRWRLVNMNGGCHEDPVYMSDNLLGNSVGCGDSDIGILQVIPGYLSNAWSGVITQDTTWSGTIRVMDDLTFTDGTILTIVPGTNVFLEEGAKLKIDSLVISGSGSVIFSDDDLMGGWTNDSELEIMKNITINTGSTISFRNYLDVKFNGSVIISGSLSFGNGIAWFNKDFIIGDGGKVFFYSANIYIQKTFQLNGYCYLPQKITLSSDASLFFNVEIEKESLVIEGSTNSSVVFNSKFSTKPSNLIYSGDHYTFGDNLIVNFNDKFTLNDGANISFGNNTVVNIQDTTILNAGSSCTFGENSEVNFHDTVYLHGTFVFGEYSTISYYNYAYFYRTSHCTYMPHTTIYYMGGSGHSGEGEFCSSSIASFQEPATFDPNASYNFSTNSTVTLNECIIDSAATVNFDHANLFVNDSLLVYGQFWADNCTIDFGNDTTKAQGIIFEGGGASLSRITDSIVRDCMDGITIINSSPLIKTSEFFNMEKRGFNIIGIDAEPEIRQCYVHTTGTYPLQMLSESDPTLVDNRFYGIGKTGARIWGADGVFTRNEFRSQTESGVFMFSSTSAPQFYSFADSGGNMFDMSQIATQAVFIGGGSPLLGDYPNITGNNIFKNRGRRYYIYNDTPGNIIAELSWWANGTGTGSYYNADGGNVDFSPKLDVEPPAGPLLLKAAASPFNAGFEKYRQKDYAGAMQDLKQMLQQDKTSIKADQAVFRMSKAARKIGRLGELEAFLGDLKKERDPQIQYHSRNWLCYLYASRNDMKNAEKLLDEVPKGSSYERTMLLDICSYYASLKDMKNAERIAGILRERHNNDVLEMELEAALEGWIDFTQVKGQTKARRRGVSIPVPQPYIAEEAATASPADTVAFQAGIYPNPFNSSTTINFNVEKDSPVQIAIYDLLGRRVQTLVDERRATGSYRAVWNGCDNTGRSVASGIYFVRMRCAARRNHSKFRI